MVERDGLRDRQLDDPCHGAARNGHTEVVGFLLDHGADVNARGFFAAPALHWAAHHGYEDTVRLLLARGADPTLRDTRFDATAADWATENGHAGLAALLRGR